MRCSQPIRHGSGPGRPGCQYSDLQESANRGLSINEGIAVDARLVKSASSLMSNDDLKGLKEKRDTPEGKLDKQRNPLKFSRDLKSDCTIKNDKPHYGLKEHASVDVENGFKLATTMTKASMHDTNYLPSPAQEDIR